MAGASEPEGKLYKHDHLAPRALSVFPFSWSLDLGFSTELARVYGLGAKVVEDGSRSHGSSHGHVDVDQSRLVLEVST